MQRFIPSDPDWSDPWSILLGEGSIDYLVLAPSENNRKRGMFEWVTDKAVAQENTGLYYPNSEGVEVVGNYLVR